MSTDQQPVSLEESGFPLILPETYTAEYLAEGAANVVYRIIAPASTPGESELEEYGENTPPPTEYSPSPEDPFEGHLLRLRKCLPTTTPAPLSHASFQTTISPLLPSKHVIPQRLIALPPTFINTLNATLHAAETSHTRPAKRHGVYLANDAYGLCVKDMSARPGEAMREFKPKWLAASPSAPRGSRRCRTCARRAREREVAPDADDKDGRVFCPLDLLSDDLDVLLAVAACIVGADPGDMALVPRLARWLLASPLLRVLRDLQVRLDPCGVLDADPVDVGFRTAMTLRDCAVFVRFPVEGELEVRIGDLDLKSGLKADYWKGNEWPLVEEGWYEGRGEEEGEGMGCALGR